MARYNKYCWKGREGIKDCSAKTYSKERQEANRPPGAKERSVRQALAGGFRGFSMMSQESFGLMQELQLS